MVARSRMRLLPWLLPLVVGCAARPAAVSSPASSAQRIEMEPLRIEVVREGEAQRVEAYDAATLFEQAGADLNERRFAAAAVAYDRLVRTFPDSRYVLPALYNAGLALEGAGDFAAATTHYRTLVERFPATKDALDALFRLGACYAEINNWAASAETFARALEQRDLSVGDRVEALGRRGLAQYNLKDVAAAERTFREAVTYHRDHETVERLENDFFLALCRYYLGEISHEQFRAIPVRLPEKQMKEDLDSKAQLFILAQRRYIDTAAVKNAAWATAAGYQMGLLYRELYDALVEAPIPPQLSAEARQVYVEELKKTIEPLLRRAIRTHELTQQVAQRTGVDNDFVHKSNQQLEQLRALLGPGDLPPPPPTQAPVAPPRPTRPEHDKRAQPPSMPSPEHYSPRVVL